MQILYSYAYCNAHIMCSFRLPTKHNCRECVERSSVVEWEEADVPPLPSANCDDVQFRRLILVGPDSHFIYGGDAVDKGPGASVCVEG